MGSLATVISAFETSVGASAERIAQYIVFFLGVLFLIWTVYQLLGYFRAWAAGSSSFFDMTMYFIRNNVLLIIVVAFLLQ
jgi:integrating conjugative element protein (TIGR03758 family)